MGRQAGVPRGFTRPGGSHFKVLLKWILYLSAFRHSSQLLMVLKWMKCKWRDEGGQSAKPKLCQRWVKVLQGEDFLCANDPGPFEVHPTLETLETRYLLGRKLRGACDSMFQQES